MWEWLTRLFWLVPRPHATCSSLTSVGKPFTFTAILPKEQLMKATGREGWFYRVPFIMNTHFHTENVQAWDEETLTEPWIALKRQTGAMWWLLYTVKYNTHQPERIWWTHDEEWVKLCSSLPERTAHWCQKSTGANTHLLSEHFRTNRAALN